MAMKIILNRLITRLSYLMTSMIILLSLHMRFPHQLHFADYLGNLSLSLPLSLFLSDISRKKEISMERMKKSRSK